MTAYLRTACKGPAACSEAARWLDEECAGRPLPPLLIVVGLGEGHLLDALEQRGSTTKVLAIEPDPQMANAFAARRDWSQWRSSGRLVHLVHPDYAGADEAWRLFPKDANACHLMVNPSLDPRHPSTGDAARVAQKILYGVKANAEARRQFAPRYLTNVIRNVPAIARGTDVRALTDAYRGVPAVIAAAGPSLDRAMAELAGVTEGALLIAVDTALRPLLHAGIAPHLVVAIDPSMLNARHFQALPECPHTWLVAESALDRSATSHFDGRTFWLRVSKHQPWPWLNKCGIDVGQVDVWGSVLTAALQVAILAGCDPIVLVGADLAFTAGRPYCRTTTYEFDWAWHAAIGRSLETAWQQHLDSTRPHPSRDLHGGTTMSSASLESFRDWIVARARRSGRRVINATGAGILFGDGVEHGSLAGSLAGLTATPSLQELTSRVPSLGNPEIAQHIVDVRRALANRERSPLIAEWADFSGDGFDADAIASALQQAEDECATVERGVATRQWRLPRAGWASQVLMCLPEATHRFSEGLQGLRPTSVLDSPPLGRSDRAALLIDALDLLGSIKALLERRIDLERTPHAGLLTAAPAAALFAWPEEIRWPVATFEALLGQVWAHSVSTSRTFIDGPVLVRDVGKVTSAVEPATASNAALARLVLALEWVTCACSLEPEVPEELRFARASLAAMLSATEGSIGLTTERATLTLRASSAHSSASIELSFAVSEAALARVLTGTWRSRDWRSDLLVGATTSGLTVSMSLHWPDRAHSGSGQTHVEKSPPSIAPTVLAEEAGTRAVIAYVSSEGVVCVRPQTNQSLLVREDGRIEPHLEWPRPIVAELPLGTRGAVAWGRGLSPEQDEPAYVMYRIALDADVEIQQLTVRPWFGVWWNNRLYWQCLSPRPDEWTGVASWAPGEELSLVLAGLTLCGMHPRDGALELHPCVRNAEGGVVRRLLTRGWTWTPGQPLQSLDLGPFGAMSSRASQDRWQATAHPEADLVSIEDTSGQALALRCYYPLRLAWVGRSLLVSTLKGDLLLFRDAAGALAQNS